MRWSAIGRRLALAGLFIIIGMPALLIVVYRWVPPPITPFMLKRAIVNGAPIDQHWVPLRQMSRHIVRAVVAAEDTRFVQHNGFDWTEMEEALHESRRGRRLRGASTITMQCARTLFLWPGRSIVRKGIEAYLTVVLEALWPKARILEVYLNLVEWGDGVYGCDAAARRYFNIACTDLDAEQAAQLAAILPAPRRWSARHPGPYVRKRTALILKRMPQVAVPHS